MQMIYCPNCAKLTGFKRALGFGTFFMVLLTCGLWLLVIPLYPPRCITCGLTRGTAVFQNLITWYRSGNSTAKIFISGACIVFLLAAVFVANTPTKPKSATIIDGPAYLASLERPSIPSSDNPPTRSADPLEDHELHLVPNLFGRGAVSDGRTYSVALISAYQSKIPPATALFVQGIITGQTGPNAIAISDEQDQDQSLTCSMSPEEFEDASFLYHTGDHVQAYGTYAHTADGMQLLRECRVASPRDKVVRLGSAQVSNMSRDSGEENRQTLGTNDTSARSQGLVYNNERFGFSIQYPQSFVPQQAPQNGDGLEFRSPDGKAILVVYGANNYPGETTKDLYQNAIKDIHGPIAYSRLAENWFVVSWQDQDKITYEKMFVGVGAHNALTATYPATQEADYSGIVTNLVRSFQPGDLSQAQ